MVAEINVVPAGMCLEGSGCGTVQTNVLHANCVGKRRTNKNGRRRSGHRHREISVGGLFHQNRGGGRIVLRNESWVAEVTLAELTMLVPPGWQRLP